MNLKQTNNLTYPLVPPIAQWHMTHPTSDGSSNTIWVNEVITHVNNKTLKGLMILIELRRVYETITIKFRSLLTL